jgi:hypothetical protein
VVEKGGNVAHAVEKADDLHVIADRAEADHLAAPGETARRPDADILGLGGDPLEPMQEIIARSQAKMRAP